MAAAAEDGKSAGEKTFTPICCPNKHDRTTWCKEYSNTFLKDPKKNKGKFLSHLIRTHIKENKTGEVFVQNIAEGARAFAMGTYFGDSLPRPGKPPQYSHWEQKMKENWDKCKGKMTRGEYARNYAKLLFGFKHDDWFPGLELDKYKTLNGFELELSQVSNRSARATPIPKLNHPN